MGWIYALTLPIRSLYATDSKAMHEKAKQMIQHAKKNEEKKAKAEKLMIAAHTKNPGASKSTATCGRSHGKPSSREGSAIRNCEKSKGTQLLCT